MYKTLALQVVACATLAVATLHAQITTPAPSPAAKVEQTIGLTDVTVTYSRPGVKGREIFGDGPGFLVPYGEVWRTGANRNTVIAFGKDVTVGGEALPAGEYALYTKPMADRWELYFYTETNNGGLPGEWDESKVAATVMADAMTTDETIQNFVVLFDELANDGANMYLAWANTMVRVPIAVGTEEEAMASIERTLAGPTAGDYYSAATYYYESGKDLEQAYTWIKQANEMNAGAPKYWQLRRQALIEAKLGRKEEAVASAKQSLELAREAGNMDYVRMNEADIEEWSM